MALSTNLVSYWKLDESSGNAADSVGSNTLTNTNTVTYAAGKINNGVVPETTGSKYLIKTSESTLPSGSNARTISLWFKMPSLATTNGVIFCYGTGVAYQLFKFYNSGANTIAIDIGAEAYAISYTFSTNTWYHLVATLPGSGSKVFTTYVNGLSVGTLTFTNAINTVNSLLTIGVNIDRTSVMNGMVDEVGVWSRALSADEVSQLFNSGRGNAYTFTDTPSLYGGISYWKLDESSGNAADSIGSNTGTNTNVTYGACKINNGASGNASTSLLNFGNSTGITMPGAQDFSVSFWFYKNNNTADGYVFGNTSAVSPYGNYNFYTDHTAQTLIFGCYNTSGTYTPVSSAVLSTGTWYHVVGTQSGTTSSLYINAGTPTTATFSGTRASTTYSVGAFARPTDSAADFDGKLDEIGIWNRALTASEVSTLYAGGMGLQYPWIPEGSFFIFF